MASISRSTRIAIGGDLARLRAARLEFSRHPAAAFLDFAAIPDSDLLRMALREAGVEPRRFAEDLKEIEEASEYAIAAFENEAWDATEIELDRIIAALARIEAGLGLRPYRVKRRNAPRLRIFEALNILFYRRDEWLRFLLPWWQIDAALRQLATARRTGDARRMATALMDGADPRSLRRRYRVGRVAREVRREIDRLFEDAEEAADYAAAALDEGAMDAAAQDLDRLDSAFRALRHILQREAPVALPEPWPLRLPGRLFAAHRLRQAVRREPTEVLGSAGPEM